MEIQADWRELLGWVSDWTGEPSEGAVARRAKFIRRSRLQNRAFLSDMIDRVRRERLAMARDYARPYRRRLQLEARVGATNDIGTLLNLASMPGDSAIDRRRRFEAIVHFDQACMLAVIDTRDSYYELSADFERFLEELSSGFFGSRVREIDVDLLLDPENEFRVCEFAFRDTADASFTVEGVHQWLPSGPYGVTEPSLPCRTLKDGRIVYVHERIKSQYDTYLKALMRFQAGETDPFSVRDRLGLRFVVPTEEEARRVIDDIRAFVRGVGGESPEVPLDNFGVERPVDRGNPDSSTAFNAAKADLVWNDRKIEVQALTFKDFFSSEYSSGPENHEIYKMRRALRNVFPFNFSSEIYGISWEEQRDRLIAQKRGEILRNLKAGFHRDS